MFNIPAANLKIMTKKDLMSYLNNVLDPNASDQKCRDQTMESTDATNYNKEMLTCLKNKLDKTSLGYLAEISESKLITEDSVNPECNQWVGSTPMNNTDVAYKRAERQFDLFHAKLFELTQTKR